MSDFNIDVKSKNLWYDKLHYFCDLFNFTNLIKSENHKSVMDLFLINRTLSYQKKNKKNM